MASGREQTTINHFHEKLVRAFSRETPYLRSLHPADAGWAHEDAERQSHGGGEARIHACVPGAVRVRGNMTQNTYNRQRHCGAESCHYVLLHRPCVIELLRVAARPPIDKFDLRRDVATFRRSRPTQRVRHVTIL